MENNTGTVPTNNEEAEACPKSLIWSAFGASYMDTVCIDGELGDLDGGDEPGMCSMSGIPCPFCRPAEFTEYQFGGGYVVPLCSVDEARLPDKAVIHYHDGQSLRWSAHCPEHGEQPVLMRDMAEQDGFNEEAFQPWVIA